MSQPAVLALGSMLPPEMDRLEADYSVVKLWREANPDAAIKAVAPKIQAVLSFAGGTGVSARLMEALPNLELIVHFGAGLDNVDLAAARARHVAVANTPDTLTDDTADIALALLLSVSRRVAEGDMFVRAGKWTGGQLPLGTSLSGKTAGIVGLGRIGQAIARRCAAFNLNVIYHGPRPKPDHPWRYYSDLATMMRDSDYVILCCPGGAETRHLVNRSVLGAMKPSAYLINVSRGSVVDQDALVEVLVNRKIGGAGLDVYAAEPHVPDELKGLDNVVLLPHIGSATLETRHKMGVLVLDNLRAYFAGGPLLTPVRL